MESLYSVGGIIHNCSSLYHPPPPSISGIDDAQNRVLLTKTLHAHLARGVVAFLKIRNFDSSILAPLPVTYNHF
jgi:hypothetical protein